MPRQPRRAVKLAVVAASIILGLLICEVLLRVAGYSYPIFYEPDERVGYVLKPGLAGLYRKEGRSFVRINSDGLRDREHDKSKESGTLRIAVLGDSYAEALQVEQEEAFWSVMERQLEACATIEGRRIEVINFGVSGYGTAQQLITLREKVWAYSPDVVLLAVTTYNDVIDNHRALKQTDKVPYFVLRDGALVLDDSFRETRAFRLRNSRLNRAGHWLRDNLRFVQAIHEAHGAIKSRLAARRAQGTTTHALTTTRLNRTETGTPAAGRKPPAGVGLENLIYTEPFDETWREAWAVTEALIAQMNREVTERGARFFVVTLSNPMQVHPSAAAREQFLERVGGTDLFHADRRFKSLGEREGFPVHNLAPELQQFAQSNSVALHGFDESLYDGHWNQTGHRVAGQLLADRLCPALAEEQK